MYHFFTDKEGVNESTITITGTDVNHIKNVLRMKKGEKSIISDGQGNDYLCEILEYQDNKVIFEIITDDVLRTELDSRFYLFQGLPKSEKMELIIQKTVELGVYEIIPVSMKRSIVKIDEKKKDAKIKRWQALSESAAKQSKRGIIPKVNDIMNFKEALDYAQNLDMIIMPYENHKGMAETKKILNEIKPGMSVGIFIGPEGGFDEKEVQEAVLCNAKLISLGRRILRTETAGLTTLSILMYLLEE